MGALIMSHSDDNGLVLPPHLAPIQVVIVPIYKSLEQLAQIDEKVSRIVKALQALGISVKYDNADNKRPGFKFADYELKGVPVRLVIGGRDLENNTVEVMRRDTLEKKTLATDRALTPFTYLTSERLIKQVHRLDDGREVLLKGFIDRIDMKEGKMRIVDYKTGKDKTDFKSIEELFDKEKKDRRKAIMQVFMYAMMVTDEDRPQSAIVPAIYQVQELFSPQKFDPYIKWGYSPLDDYSTIDKEFRQAFNNCLQEIFDANTPFTQTVHIGDEGPCSYCPFATICLQSTP